MSSARVSRKCNTRGSPHTCASHPKSFKMIDPSLDSGIDLSEEYAQAEKMAGIL